MESMTFAASPYPFIIRQAGDRQFVEAVQQLIDDNIEKFMPNGTDPQRRKWWKLADDIDPVLNAKKLELIERFGIADWIPDPNFCDLIGWISEGGAVHVHADPACERRMHIRINLLVGAPESGCVPLLDGIPIDIGLGDAWLCFASHCRHATTPVAGKKHRSIVSYGLQVEQTAAFGLFSRYIAWKMANARPAAATV
ncbi:MAG: hypothetical protein K9G60_12310 [Pseudolabrys sp.]|nr:hypothetical protein [Pseudolabrys sp.]